jgi:PAS domain S-box-containing protein
MPRAPSVRFEKARPLLIRLVPLFIFIASSALTVLIWSQDVKHVRKMLARHTEDISAQVARRLQGRFDLLVRGVSIFADKRFTDESADGREKRLAEFASILINEIPAYHAIRFVRADGSSVWNIVTNGQSSCLDLNSQYEQLLQESQKKRAVLLSPPSECKTNGAFLIVVVPLTREQEFIGDIVVEFLFENLIGDIVPRPSRSEFNIQIADGNKPFFTLSEDDRAFSQHAMIRASDSVSIRNRTWQVTIVPRNARIEQTGWTANLALPLLGFILSISLSLLVHLLFRRMELYRRSRDETLNEMLKREQAQEALRASEARYRSVFNSATEGLIVVDQDDRIVDANPVASAMHGYTPEAFSGLSYRDLIASDHQYLYEEFRRQLSQYGSVHLDSMHVTRDNKRIDVEVRGTNFHFGGASRVLAILTDTTDRKKAVQQQAMLSRKALMAQEEERARVSRELHDELGQILTALHLELDMLRKRSSGSGDSHSQATSALSNALQMVEKAAEELRRVCRGLRPPLLDDLGVDPAVRLLIEEFEQRTGVKTAWEVQLNEELKPIPTEIALCIYRIMQESLHNISRHAGAKNVRVSLMDKGDEIVLSINDDGKGFDADRMRTSEGFGIAGMRERTTLVNGILDIHSEPGRGTKVLFRVPR